MNNTTLRHFWSLAAWLRISAATLVIGLAALPAWAQLSRVGTNPNLGASPIRGTDTAFDPVNNVFLVVGSTAGNVSTPLFGAFTDVAGNPLAPPFQINNGGENAHFPRVTYSPNVSNGAGGFGGFLVTWHGGAWTTTIRARVVAYPNRVVSSETIIPNLASTTSQEKGAAVAYSSASHLFLVTWEGDVKIWGALVGTGGNVVGGPFQISVNEPGGGARDPGVAYNPYTNEFGVVYTGWGSGSASTTFVRVSAAGTVLRHNTFNFAPDAYITDVAFNVATGRYMAVWWGQGGSFGAEIDANGDVVGKGLLSSITGTYDSLGLSYNPTTGTFLLVGQGCGTCNSYNVWSAELNSRGARTSADTEISSLNVASFYPRTAASSSDSRWNVSFHSSGTMFNQIVYSTSRNGGPAGTLGTFTGGGGGTPAPPPPPSGGCPGTAPFPGAVCVNGGWIPGDTGGGGSGGGGTGGSSGGTGGCTTPDPFTAIGGGTCVDGGWIPGGGGSSGGSTGGCPGSAPFPGAVCVNGGWVQGSGGSSGGSGGCTTPDPFTAMGGGTCVNGGWIFGGGGSSGGGGSTGGCTTGSPGAGWICVNGGWVQGSNSGVSGGCTTPDPFAAIGGGTCINGGWVYGSSSVAPSSSTSSSCSTPDPFVALGGGTCVNGGWTLNDSSSCATPDPFTAMGGGVCIAGGWVPKG